MFPVSSETILSKMYVTACVLVVTAAPASTVTVVVTVVSSAVSQCLFKLAMPYSLVSFC